ncbi:hypothetical protein BC937DRAFT_87096, partial [Endogone sp. FLAS-F59071]
KLRQAGV